MQRSLCCLLLLGCDVYSADLLDAASNDARVGCPRGLADCDGNGTCESDLASEATCGSCDSTCEPGATCVAGVLCVEGDVRDFDVGPLPDAGFDGGRDAGPTDSGGVDAPGLDAPMDSGIEPCTVRPPGPPAIGDSADLSNHYWALRNIVINQGGGVWEGIGYDLDGQCTDSLDDDFICTPPAAEFPPFDGPQGVDNTFGDKVLALLNTYDPTFQSSVRGIMDTGQTAVVVLNDWNGTDNDPMVSVRLVRALGKVGGAMPTWDGTDELIFSNDSYNSSDDELLRDEGAYVTDGTIVARFADRQPIDVPWLGGTSFTIRLTDSILTARISGDRSTLIDLVFQGRFARVDLETALENVGFCAGGTARGFVDVELNQSADVRAFPGGGGGGTCDAISMAFEYTATRVESGPRQDPPIPPPVECLP